jgi:hypothetical protein
MAVAIDLLPFDQTGFNAGSASRPSYRLALLAAPVISMRSGSCFRNMPTGSASISPTKASMRNWRSFRADMHRPPATC